MRIRITSFSLDDLITHINKIINVLPLQNWHKIIKGATLKRFYTNQNVSLIHNEFYTGTINI